MSDFEALLDFRAQFRHIVAGILQRHRLAARKLTCAEREIVLLLRI